MTDEQSTEKEMLKTDWFPGTVKPVREGVYEVVFEDTGVAIRWYAQFRTGLWRKASPFLLGAAIRYAASPHQNLPWRGLTEEQT